MEGDRRTSADALVGQCPPCTLLAMEHRPADVVAQPLVVEYELPDPFRQLVALPPALESPRALPSPSDTAARAALIA